MVERKIGLREYKEGGPLLRKILLNLYASDEFEGYIVVSCDEVSEGYDKVIVKNTELIIAPSDPKVGNYDPQILQSLLLKAVSKINEGDEKVKLTVEVECGRVGLGFRHG